MEEEKPRLDLTLPDADVVELMQAIVEIVEIEVVLAIFISAYGRENLIARSFDHGAADYVVKPFSPTELTARIRAARRRREVSQPLEPYVHGYLTIDFAQRRATLAGAAALGASGVLAAGGQCRAGADLRAPAGAGLVPEGRRRPSAHARHREQAALAGRRRPQPQVRLHRAPGGALGAEWRGAGRGPEAELG